MLEALLIGIM